MDGTAAARRGGVVLTVLLLLITLPFELHWLDFEATRRALLIALAGLALLGLAVAPSTLSLRFCWPLVLFGAWVALRAFGVTNPGEALLRAAYLLALGLAVTVGVNRRALARASLPLTAVLAILTLLQQAGISWPIGLGRPGEAVATLGNRNAAAEVLAMGFALACWSALRGEARRAALWIAMLAAVALGANGTRAGWLAVGVVLIGIAIGTRTAGARRYVPLLILALAVAAGGWWRIPTGAESPPPSAAAASPATPSTVALRLALWRGALDLCAERPLLGQGTGQFRFEYPRFRRQDEIEITTFGRRFPTVVESAHQDPLEVGVELGVIGLLLLGWVLWGALRGVALLDLLPLVPFAVTALVRSPLGNAPAALLAALWLGAVAPRGRVVAAGRVLRTGAALAGGALLWIGLGPLFAAHQVAAWQVDQNDSRLDVAIAWHGSEPRYRSLRIQARCDGLESDGTLRTRTAASYAACEEDVGALASLDPFNTTALYLRAQLAQGAGDLAAAQQALTEISRLDPREPRAQALSAVLLFGKGRVSEAIATLYADPHPLLRRRLVATLDAFASAPAMAEDAAARGLLIREGLFIRTLDLVTADPASAATRGAVESLTRAFPKGEPRLAVLRARVALAAGELEAADALALPKPELDPAAAGLLAPLLEALRARDAWRTALAR